MINKAKETLPKLRAEIREEVGKGGLKEEQIKILLKQKQLDEFKSLLNIIDDPSFIFKILIELPKEISSHEKKDISKILNLDIIESIIEAVSKNKINKSDVKHIMEEIVHGKSVEESIKIEKADLTEIESEIAKIIHEKPGLSIGGYMGLIMEKFKGKVNGKQANEILKKYL